MVTAETVIPYAVSKEFQILPNIWRVLFFKTLIPLCSFNCRLLLPGTDQKKMWIIYYWQLIMFEILCIEKEWQKKNQTKQSSKMTHKKQKSLWFIQIFVFFTWTFFCCCNVKYCNHMNFKNKSMSRKLMTAIMRFVPN